MKYSSETINLLRTEHISTQDALLRLILDTVKAAESVTDTRTREYMQHGVARRLRTMRRCLDRVFVLFPPDQATPIGSDELDDVQISVQSFVLNTFGCFENMAWAFVLRHGLEARIGNRKRVGLFLGATQQFLPRPLRDRLTSPGLEAWHTEYLKNFRDALAHRIPLYVPPRSLTQEEANRHSALERESFECIKLRRWDKLEEVRAEQESLGSVCLLFVHAYDSAGNVVYLHGQLLSDARTILDFVPLFLQHWHEVG